MTGPTEENQETMEASHDPFGEARRERGLLVGEFQGQMIPMILRHRDVQAAAKDWKTFSSDAPFRVPIPSEEDVRSIRQLPVEIDPPDHTDYRRIVAPFFRRPNQPEMEEKVRVLVEGLVADAMGRASVEIVREFALPLQSRALAYLLDVPESEAETWIGWGTHVFRDGEGGPEKGAALERYIHRQLDRAEAEPGDDFFSALTQAEFRGRPLTREEMAGFANLAFAGGRDTIINSVSSIVGHLGEHAEALDELRGDAKRILTATEEFLRVFTPLTHIARVCPVDTEVHGAKVEAGHRVSLCWASANHDETVFDAPDEVRLDRRPNPHLAFGSGTHLCLGAAHTRLIIHTLLRTLCSAVGRIEILDAVPHIEDEACYRRRVGYLSLHVRLVPA